MKEKEKEKKRKEDPYNDTSGYGEINGMYDLPTVSDERARVNARPEEAGVLYKYYKAPSIYPPELRAGSFTETCKRCGGKKTHMLQTTRTASSCHIIWGFQLSNPSYIGADNKPISFKNEYTFVKQFVENFEEIEEGNRHQRHLHLFKGRVETARPFLASCICFEMFNRHHLMPLLSARKLTSGRT